MCMSMPKPKKAPAPPSALDSQADALANMAQRRAGGTTRQSTFATTGLGAAPTYSPQLKSLMGQ
jgi:hypothetical protein